MGFPNKALSIRTGFPFSSNAKSSGPWTKPNVDHQGTLGVTLKVGLG